MSVDTTEELNEYWHQWVSECILTSVSKWMSVDTTEELNEYWHQWVSDGVLTSVSKWMISLVHDRWMVWW